MSNKRFTPEEIGAAFAGLAVIFMVFAFGYGWVENIIKLVSTISTPITEITMLTVLRIVGIFIAPFGAILGYL